MNMDCNTELHEIMFEKTWTALQKRAVEMGLVIVATNLKNGKKYLQLTPEGERWRKFGQRHPVKDWAWLNDL